MFSMNLKAFLSTSFGEMKKVSCLTEYSDSPAGIESGARHAMYFCGL